MARGKRKAPVNGGRRAPCSPKRTRTRSEVGAIRTTLGISDTDEAGPSGLQPGQMNRRRLGSLTSDAPVEEGIAEDSDRDNRQQESSTIRGGGDVGNWMSSTRLQIQEQGERDCPRERDSTIRIVEAIESTLRTVREATIGEASLRIANRLSATGKLPEFSGNPLEWRHFKEAYLLTSEMGGYNERENMARLFTALKGEARDSVSSLFAIGRDASLVMRTLELNFGNKNMVVQKIVSDIKELPSIDSGKMSLTKFATKLQNAVTALRSLDLVGYLHSPDLTQSVGNKIPSALKYAYNKYSSESSQNKTELEKLADFLGRESELAEAVGVFNTESNTDVTSSRAAIPKEQLRPKRRRIATERAYDINLVEGGTLLKILPVRIVGPIKTINTFALLDEGSTVTLVDKKILSGTGVKGTRVIVTLKGIDTREKLVTNSEKIEFDIQGEGNIHKIKQAIAIRDLRLPVQSLSKDIVQYTQHKEKIAVQSYTNARPRILIGQDNWRLIVNLELRTLENTDLALSRCLLGWTLHGQQQQCTEKIVSSRCAMQQASFGFPDSVKGLDQDESLDQLMRNYFEIDSLGVREIKKENGKVNRVMKILNDTSRREGNVWEVGLLWKENRAPHVDSKIIAQRRLDSLERKLDRDRNYAAKYYAELDRVIESGYAVKVNPELKREKFWYLPHFGVQNINKPGKVRVVFDAAAKTNGLSLNDQLEAGPDLLQSLPGILMRFRLYEFAFKADIKDMFLQIKVRDEDRGAQRFLWRGKRRVGNPDTYEMTHLIFGAKSSPCSALYIKKKNAVENAEASPEAAKSIVEDSYMDDYLASRGTVVQAKKLIHDLDSIPETVRQQGRDDMRLCDRGGERVLGLIWSTQADVLHFDLGMTKVSESILAGEKRPTKREFLRIIMSVFDPLGLLSPFTLKSKILMQEIWRSGIEWDQPLRDEEQLGWVSWLEGLRKISSLRIPRCYTPTGIDCAKFQLHIFCDASLKGYAAAAYLRVVMRDGFARVALIMAKTRVTPLKPLSVPRLELQAALLGARLGKTVADELKIEISERIFWSDSITIVRWIKSEPRTRQVFVANRLGEIGELTLSSEWRWLPSSLNPADDATRWSKKEMSTNDRWFTGPEFLHQAESNWPREKDITEAEKLQIDAIEIRKVKVYVAQAYEYYVPYVARMLGWPGLLVAARRIKTAFDRWRGRSRTQITTETIISAEHYCYRSIQSEMFVEELEALKAKKGINKKSKIVALKPYVDEKGILRAWGRVTKIAEEEFNNHPIILDSKHPATKLLIEHYHRRFYHASNESVVNELRQQFYIIGIRRALRSIISRCVICRIRRAKPPNPIMAALPAGRIAYRQRPFCHCGVDYFGPMLVKIGRRREKRWGVLFTCLTTRAIHLELAHSLSTSSTIMAIKRLAARRGSPLVMYRDNGTNFKGASKELRDAIATIEIGKISNYALENRI
ncbi:uncharacterized protein LOC143365004, partial [Halictus rubicundus]|uniref:uncharacterized protein LOC143365004 n=1 Tax=Halictus rubicundus TaxID=77578 RepID=UPI0040355334